VPLSGDPSPADKRAQMRDVDSLPTNARIAAALLEVLATSGDVAARARALHTAGGEAAALRVPGWIREPSLRAMLHAAQADRRLARRVGQALVAPAAIGFPLWYSGVATPEKMYRRCDKLLARESRGGRYSALAIGEGTARIAFDPEPEQAPELLYCEIRAGMLEAIPLLFGLLPARVEERACSQRGAPQCVFSLRFGRVARRGLWLGAAFGALLGPLAVWGAAALPLAVAAPVAALAFALLAAAAGRSTDLARQLEAVAGARRGQLALLDQADRTLAEKMDQLAKLDTALEASVGSAGAASDGRPQRAEGAIRDTLEERSRELREGPPRVDLAALAERAIASLRPGLPSQIAIANEVLGEVTVIRGGERETIAGNFELYQGDIIETGEDGAVNILFEDNTSFGLSEDARMSVDEFQYDSEDNGGSSFLSMLKGLFVYTAGVIGKDEPRNVETPAGALGIRGDAGKYIQPIEDDIL